MIIYIDDRRVPLDKNITLVKDYFEFVNIINSLYPNEFYNDTQIANLFISFDHDLACYVEDREYTGMDCAIFLYEKGIIPAGICVHSDNVCADRIQSYLSNYAKVNNIILSNFNKAAFKILD